MVAALGCVLCPALALLTSWDRLSVAHFPCGPRPAQSAFLVASAAESPRRPGRAVAAVCESLGNS